MMKKRSCNYPVVLILLIFQLTNSCKKEEPAQLPVVSTTPATNITVSTATSGGTITSDGGDVISVSGVCWSTNSNPSLSDSKTVDNTNVGQFVSDLTGLNAGTTYHVRAYATNSVGTGYGADISFSTNGKVPASITQAASEVTTTEATLTGTVNPNDLPTTVTFEYGTTANYGSTVTAPQSPVNGNTIINVTVVISGLTPGTTFHYRIITVNSLGTTYGSDITFTTTGLPPVSVTQAASGFSSNGATLNGSVNANSLSTTVTFEYGTTTGYGNSVTATQSPLTSSTNSNVSATLTGLFPSTIYHFRIKASNSQGTVFGDDMTFTTSGQSPVTSVSQATNITTTGATLNGSVIANNQSTTVVFEYGTSTNYGNTQTASQSPVTGITSTNVNLNISGLTAGVIYHYRIRATNLTGTTYSNDATFTYTISDVEGNSYKTVTIGTQIWMAENLKTTKYADGTPIQLVSSGSTWETLAITDKAYCWYNNDIANKDNYGALYTWAAAMNGSPSSNTNPSNIIGVCPTGWHLPSDAEWTQLENYLITNGFNYDGSTIDNKIAKALASTSGWQSTSAIGSAGNTDYPDKRNSSGFTAFPRGYRDYMGAFAYSGIFGFWWSATDYDDEQAWYRYIYYSDTADGRLYVNETKKNGMSIRCVKN